MVTNVIPPVASSSQDDDITELVLSRKPGESIQVGNVCITVDQIKGKRTRIRIAAPRSTDIRRSELPHAA